MQKRTRQSIINKTPNNKQTQTSVDRPPFSHNINITSYTTQIIHNTGTKKHRVQSAAFDRL